MTTSQEIASYSASEADLDSHRDSLPRRGRLSLVTRLTVLLLVIAGAAVRIWILTSQFGQADSDESVVGLMAKGFLDGEPSVYFWGQAYGGSLEAMVTAVLFKVFGVEILALKVAPILLNIAASLVLWRIALRIFDARIAAVGAAMFWSSPFVYVWLSTKERGFYEAGLLAGAVFMLCVLKMLERSSWKVALIGGLSAGVALWTTPQAMYLVFPAALVYLARAPLPSKTPNNVRDILRDWVKGLPQVLRAWPAIPGFFLGLFPAIISNVRSDWMSLELPRQGAHTTTYWQRLSGFFTEGFPLVIGAKIPYMGDWVLPIVGPIMVAGTVAAIVFAVVHVVRKPGSTNPGFFMMVLIALFYPFIFAISPFSWYLGDGRYLSFLWAPLAFLLASAAAKFREVVAVVLAALCIFTMAALLNWPSQKDSHDLLTEDLDPLIKKLESDGVRHAYADYWIAYRATLDNKKGITISPAYSHRNTTLKESVETSTENTVFISFKNSREEQEFGARSQAQLLTPKRVEVGAFAIYTFDQDLPAEQLYDLAGY